MREAMSRWLGATERLNKMLLSGRKKREPATKAWHMQQAELARELGITLKDWNRIADMLSRPPPVRVGRHIMMISVMIGRSIVVDAAVEEAISAPLKESVKSAAQRRAQQGGAGRKRKEVCPTQIIFGKDVTDLMKDLENAENATAQRNAAKRQKAISDANKRAITADKRVQQACSKLMGKAAGESNHLSLADLVVLIKCQVAQRIDGRAEPRENDGFEDDAEVEEENDDEEGGTADEYGDDVDEEESESEEEEGEEEESEEQGGVVASVTRLEWRAAHLQHDVKKSPAPSKVDHDLETS
ncbi:MAG: hypothetical protein SGPRY_004195 [Prymnesium sp.]